MFALYSLVLCVSIVLVTGFYLIYRDIRRLEEEIIEFSAHAHGVTSGRKSSADATRAREASSSGDEVRCPHDDAEAVECQQGALPPTRESDALASTEAAVNRIDSDTAAEEAIENRDSDVEVADAEKDDAAAPVEDTPPVDGDPAV